MFLIKDYEIVTHPDKGRGVVATADIPAGTVIGDYTGVFIPSGAIDRTKPVYDMYYTDEADIVPKDIAESDVHCINHSCEANCGTDGHKGHTVLFALRKIFKGEELSFDYFFGPQDTERPGGLDNCYCGSDYCRGTMYSNPVQYKIVEEWIEKEIKENPPPPAVIGGEVPVLDDYPKTIQDDTLFSLFGNKTEEPVEGGSELLHSPSELRKLIRESGRRVKISSLNIVCDGVLFNGRILVKPA